MGRMTWVGSVAISALMGGTAGGVAAALREPPVRPSSTRTASLVQFRELNELGDRVAAVERTLLVLQSARRLTAGGRALVEKGSEPTAGSADVAANGAPGVDDPVFFAAVQDTVDRVDADRAAEQHAEQGRRTAQIWVDQLAQTLGLSDDQRIAVTDLGIEIAQKVQELSIPEAEGEPADPRERSAQLLALSDECERRLGSVLDGTQMNAYRDLDNKMRFGFVLE